MLQDNDISTRLRIRMSNTFLCWSCEHLLETYQSRFYNFRKVENTDFREVISITFTYITHRELENSLVMLFSVDFPGVLSRIQQGRAIGGP